MDKTMAIVGVLMRIVFALTLLISAGYAILELIQENGFNVGHIGNGMAVIWGLLVFAKHITKKWREEWRNPQ